MKRKALILGTLGASFLLAGSVFAAYSVTDNADKQGFRISPGTISTDTVGSVTLAWGENLVTNVQNLAMGSENAQTRYVVLKATTAGDDSNVYQGSLEVSIEDISGKAAEAKKLIDYLSVEVKGYTYNTGTKQFASEKSTLATLNKTNATETLNVYANKDGKQVDLVITLSSEAQPYLSVINTDQVYLTVDWNKGTGDADQSGTQRVYIPKPTGWNKLYVYSYSSTGENHPWPGVELTQTDSDGNYIADLISAHTHFIFSDYGDNTKRYPEDGNAGMTKDSLEFDATHIYFDWSTHKFVEEATFPYYLVGEEGAWATLAANGLTLKNTDLPANVTEQWYAKLTVVANKDYKICSADKSTTWAGYENVEDGCKSLVTNSDGNFKFAAAGTYDIYLKHWSDGGFSISLATA